MSSAKTSLALLAFALAASTTSCASAPKDEAALAMQEAMKPASPEERAAANRADPLTRANFWAKENLKDGEDLTVSLEFARALPDIAWWPSDAFRSVRYAASAPVPSAFCNRWQAAQTGHAKHGFLTRRTHCR